MIYTQMEEEFGMVTYEAWLALLVSCNVSLDECKLMPQTDITKDDSSSAEQLREAFRGMAGEKVRPRPSKLHEAKTDMFSHMSRTLTSSMPVYHLILCDSCQK